MTASRADVEWVARVLARAAGQPLAMTSELGPKDREILRQYEQRAERALDTFPGRAMPAASALLETDARLNPGAS